MHGETLKNAGLLRLRRGSAGLRVRLATAPETHRLGCYLSVLTRCPAAPLHGTRPSMRTTAPAMIGNGHGTEIGGYWPVGAAGWESAGLAGCLFRIGGGPKRTEISRSVPLIADRVVTWMASCESAG